MELLVHDNFLLSYCVAADKQEIYFHTMFPGQEPPELTNVVFTGVIGYHFEQDDVQTITFSID